MRVFILIFLTIVLYVRCANIVAPSGGPRDTEAPKVLNVVPKNGSTNYKNKNLYVTFDEDIENNQLASKVIVSPTITGNYTVKIKKNILRLQWADTLKENTTYTFNLADGIKDITEYNTLKNYSVTFSTGPDIDSNKIQSVVQPLPGNTIDVNTKVMLFPVQDSVLHYIRLKPEYVGTVSETGLIEIPYIKKGRYTIIAINDYNKNNTWNFNEPVDIHKNIEINGIFKDSFHIQETTLDTSKLQSANSSDKSIKFLFTKGLQKIIIKDASGPYIITKINQREFAIQNQYKIRDTTIMQISIVDSVGIRSEFKKKVKFKTIDSQKDKDSIIYIEDINKKSFLKPKLDSIQFTTFKYVDSIPLTIEAPKYVTYSITNNYTNFWILFKGQKEGDSIILNAPKGAFHSINTEYNRELRRKLLTGEEKEFGNLTFEIVSKEKEYTIHITDSRKTIIYTAYNQARHHIKNLEPGEYVLSAFIDTNKNGVWDAYNPIREIPAEPIYYYKEKLLIKANWDIEDIQMIF
ncbi:MAG: Ig-like domain-containing protein [Cytophagales bacterium]|nr:Ig-like domain-containing protein [Cytophaga sp.]